MSESEPIEEASRKLYLCQNLDELANRLQISRTQLYAVLETLKYLGAPIKYNRVVKSFYYAHSFKLHININVQTITPDERKIIYGGSFFAKFTSVLFSERSKFNLATASR